MLLCTRRIRSALGCPPRSWSDTDDPVITTAGNSGSRCFCTCALLKIPVALLLYRLFCTHKTILGLILLSLVALLFVVVGIQTIVTFAKQSPIEKNRNPIEVAGTCWDEAVHYDVGYIVGREWNSLSALVSMMINTSCPGSSFWRPRCLVCGVRDRPSLRAPSRLFSQDHNSDLAGPWNTVSTVPC